MGFNNAKLTQVFPNHLPVVAFLPAPPGLLHFSLFGEGHLNFILISQIFICDRQPSPHCTFSPEGGPPQNMHIYVCKRNREGTLVTKTIFQSSQEEIHSSDFSSTSNFELTNHFLRFFHLVSRLKPHCY